MLFRSKERRPIFVDLVLRLQKKLGLPEDVPEIPLENLKLDELAAKRVYEFAFIVQPLKLEGATGSTVAPVAVR